MRQELKIFAENLKRHRTSKGLTQAALGKIIGQPASSISTWETGKVAPEYTSIKKLTEALGVSEGDLFGVMSKPMEPSPSDSLDDLSRRIHSGEGAFALAQLVFPGITPEVFELLSLSPDPKWWRIVQENLLIAADSLAPGANLPAKRELSSSHGQAEAPGRKHRLKGQGS